MNFNLKSVSYCYESKFYQLNLSNIIVHQFITDKENTQIVEFG